jgi:hypothetical protein
MRREDDDRDPRGTYGDTGVGELFYCVVTRIEVVGDVKVGGEREREEGRDGLRPPEST